MAEERRPPRNMQGLFNFCTEITASEDAPNTPNVSVMDPERREFLREALDNMTVSVAKHMATHLQTLNTSLNVLDRNSTSIDAEEEALDDLIEIVQDVDNAVDLMKLGGLSVMLRCLASPHPTLLELSCEVLGVVSQNNPKCQEELLLEQHSVLPTLLDLVDKGSTVGVQAKALYAVSCLVRGNAAGMAELQRLDGFSCLLRALQIREEQLFVKAVFLIAHLIEEHPPALCELLSMGYTELLLEYLCSTDTNDEATSDAAIASHTTDVCREHCSSALLKLCSLSDESRETCARHVGLLAVLNDRLVRIQGHEEFQEEAEYTTLLLQQIKPTPLEVMDENDVDACR